MVSCLLNFSFTSIVLTILILILFRIIQNEKYPKTRIETETINWSIVCERSNSTACCRFCSPSIYSNWPRWTCVVKWKKKLPGTAVVRTCCQTIWTTRQLLRMVKALWMHLTPSGLYGHLYTAEACTRYTTQTNEMAHTHTHTATRVCVIGTVAHTLRTLSTK